LGFKLFLEGVPDKEVEEKKVSTDGLLKGILSVTELLQKRERRKNKVEKNSNP